MGFLNNVINKIKEQPQKEGLLEQGISPQDMPLPNNLTFKVAGVNYRMEQVYKLATPMKKWNMTNEQLLKQYPGKRIYKYYFTNEPVVLVPEPTNQNDPNAIKVMVNNIHVGYVPNDLCIIVRRIMQGSCTLSSKFSGGEYKVVFDDGSAKNFADRVSIEVTITR